MTGVRYAVVTHRAEETVAQIAKYLPDNYEIAATHIHDDGLTYETVIVGEDFAGWTMDAYVLPRLSSGLYYGNEIAENDPRTAGIAYPSEAKILADANKLNAGYGTVETLTAALDVIVGHGFDDEQCGDAEYLAGHCARVARWLLWTDNQGFMSTSEYTTITEAQAEFESYAEACDAG